MIEYLEWFVIAFPLLGGLLNALGGPRFSRQTQSWLAFGGAVGAVVAWLPLLIGQLLAPGLAGLSRSLRWIKAWDGQRFIEGPLRLYIDGWSVWTALVVVILGMWGLAWVVTREHAFEGRPRWLVLSLIDGLLGAILLIILADNLWTALIGWSVAGWLLYALLGHDRSSVTWPLWLLTGDGGFLLAIGLLSPCLVSLSVDSLSVFPSADSRVGGLLPIEPVLPVARSLLVWALLARFGMPILAQRRGNGRIGVVLALSFALPGSVIWLHRLSTLLFPLTVWEIGAALVPAGLVWLADRGQMRLAAAGRAIAGWENRIAQAVDNRLGRLLNNDQQ